MEKYFALLFPHEVLFPLVDFKLSLPLVCSYEVFLTLTDTVIRTTFRCLQDYPNCSLQTDVYGIRGQTDLIR